MDFVSLFYSSAGTWNACRYIIYSERESRGLLNIPCLVLCTCESFDLMLGPFSLIFWYRSLWLPHTRSLKRQLLLSLPDLVLQELARALQVVQVLLRQAQPLRLAGLCHLRPCRGYGFCCHCCSACSYNFLVNTTGSHVYQQFLPRTLFWIWSYRYFILAS